MDITQLTARVGRRGHNIDIGRGEGVRQRTGTHAAAGLRATASPNGEVSGVNQPSAGSTRSCRSGDQNVVCDLDVSRRGFDEAAVAAIWSRRIQRAAHVDRASRHTAQQHNAAFVVFNAQGFDHAGVVDHAGQHGVSGASTHQDHTTVGLDQAAVVGQGVEHAVVDLHANHVVVLESQRSRTAAAQSDRPQRRHDAALIDNGVAQQRHVAAAGRCDAPLVDDAPRTIAAKSAGGAREAGVVQIQRRRDQ